MDSELRFYAVLWGAYGIVTIRTARGLPQGLNRVPWLALVFLLGGIGRALSLFSVGTPHPFFTTLMVIEIALPIALVGLWSGGNLQKSFRWAGR
jgi:Domain of unknown function (DUF4345)